MGSPDCISFDSSHISYNWVVNLCSMVSIACLYRFLYCCGQNVLIMSCHAVPRHFLFASKVQYNDFMDLIIAWR